MKSELHITRMDYGRLHGWWVRFYRGTREERRCISKLFSDRMHGGKRKALEQARKWREQQLRRLPRPRRGPGVGSEPGYGYVKRVVWKSEQRPKFVAWVLLERRRPAQTTYSVTLWGEQGARDKAERWLARQRKELRQRQRAREK